MKRKYGTFLSFIGWKETETNQNHRLIGSDNQLIIHNDDNTMQSRLTGHRFRLAFKFYCPPLLFNNRTLLDDYDYDSPLASIVDIECLANKYNKYETYLHLSIRALFYLAFVHFYLINTVH